MRSSARRIQVPINRESCKRHGASAVARKIDGTIEVRTLMRHDARAARIAHGVPLFFAMSPDERRNLAMVRMSRSRKKDPVNRREARERRRGNVRRVVGTVAGAL